MAAYRAFTRTWWKANKSWPNGLEPCAGKKRTIGKNLSEEEARSLCKSWNANHEPGRFSLKAEYEQQ
jgi:hypothetical protein